MAVDDSQSQESDLDRTDRLPILEGVTIDEDVEDDAERLEFSPPAASAFGADASLASELSALQSALAVEQQRSGEMERALSEGSTAAEASRVRAEEFAREAERYRSEARTLRDALAARDGTIAQVLHSLAERDAQLFALQREHAQTVPMLEARSRASAQLEVDLQAARANVDKLSLELEKSRMTVTSLTGKLVRSESDLAAGRRDLGAARVQAASFLELLRSRDWRAGFNQNLFRESDDEADAAHPGHAALRAECKRLNESVALLGAKLADHEATIAKLQRAGSAETAAHSATSRALEEALSARAELKRARDSQAEAEARHAELSAQLEQLRAEAATHEEELTVLMAHLNEARRPIQSIQADITRLNEELARKGSSIDRINEENRILRATLERTRGALEQRDLLIQRLEGSTNASVLGRVQAGIERRGSSVAPPAPPLADEFPAELIKIEGDTRTAYPLGRRTRIGRAPGCELQIDSQSVSRHHALLLKGMREVIIEDLNSTNGVLINGHKVMRHVLSDGDLITIGETHFQCQLRPGSRAPETSNDAAAAEAAEADATTPFGSDSGFSGPPGQANPQTDPQAARQTDPHIGG